MSHSSEQMRKKAEAMAESKMHMQRNVVGEKSPNFGTKPPLANEDSARGKETNSYDKDEIANSGAVGGGV